MPTICLPASATALSISSLPALQTALACFRLYGKTIPSCWVLMVIDTLLRRPKPQKTPTQTPSTGFNDIFPLWRKLPESDARSVTPTLSNLDSSEYWDLILNPLNQIIICYRLPCGRSSNWGFVSKGSVKSVTLNVPTKMTYFHGAFRLP